MSTENVDLTIPTEEVETIGASPKVVVPAAALGVIGAGLFVVGSLVSGLEDLREIGIGLFVGSPIGAAFGFGAKPGTIVRKTSA